MKKIIFKIDQQGNTTVVDAIGYGTDCKERTKNIISRLGNADTSTDKDTEQMFLPKIDNEGTISGN